MKKRPIDFLEFSILAAELKEASRDFYQFRKLVAKMIRDKDVIIDY